MITGMGFVLGILLGASVAAIHTAAFTDTSIAAQAQEKMNAGQAAPGAVEGGVAGALALPYMMILHGSMMAAVRETRRQVRQQPRP